MIPAGGTITQDTIEEIELPSPTWKLDTVKNRIAGRLDGLEAVKQAAYKILLTPRFQHLIYTANYGSELEQLIGSNPIFVQSEINRMIGEALTQDDRISSIQNLQTAAKGDGLSIEFTVISSYGSFDMTQEVKV